MSRLVSIPLACYEAESVAGLSAGAFSIPAARAAMWLSQLAYEEEADKVATVLQRWQLEPLLIFDRPGTGLLPAARTRGFLAQGRGVTVLSFGGTDPLVLANWITDLLIGRTAEGAHGGFTAALDVVWQDICRLAPPGIAPLLCVGHSLGGAIALLAALRLQEQSGLPPAAIYGFGMPRPGNASLAARINAAFGARLYRLAHGQDMVPSLPPAALGFCHAGRYLHCAGYGQFAADRLSADVSQAPANEPGPASRWRAQLAGLLAPAGGTPDALPVLTNPRPAGFLPARVGDHLPDRYWNALAGA